MAKTIQEVLDQEDVTVNVGDRLVAYTISMGFVPDNKGSTEFHNGEYNYEVVKHGTGKAVVPYVTDYRTNEIVKDEENPIIVQEGNKIMYVTGRNHPVTGDVYNNSGIYTREIDETEADRHILVIFRDFVFSEFSVGVVRASLEQPGYKDTGEDPVDDSGSGDGKGDSGNKGDGDGGGKDQ